MSPKVQTEVLYYRGEANSQELILLSVSNSTSKKKMPFSLILLAAACLWKCSHCGYKNHGLDNNCLNCKQSEINYIEHINMNKRTSIQVGNGAFRSMPIEIEEPPSLLSRFSSWLSATLRKIQLLSALGLIVLGLNCFLFWLFAWHDTRAMVNSLPSLTILGNNSCPEDPEFLYIQDRSVTQRTSETVAFHVTLTTRNGAVLSHAPVTLSEYNRCQKGAEWDVQYNHSGCYRIVAPREHK